MIAAHGRYGMFEMLSGLWYDLLGLVYVHHDIARHEEGGSALNEKKHANRCILKFIESGLGLEDGISRIKTDLHRQFQFSEDGRFSRQSLRESYAAFEAWLNKLIVTEAPPDGVEALYFSLYYQDDVIELAVSGARRWSLEDPAWACDTWYLPHDGQIQLAIFTDIAGAFSEFNHAGLYLAITVLATFLREYTERSVISLLDLNRRTLYLACGFVDGDLYNVGRLSEEGLQAPRCRFSLFG